MFTSDEPEEIIRLIKEYPEFRAVYEEGYEICLNTERVMEMFSKELYELDRNTVQYMIDEMQDTIDTQQDTIGAQKDELNKKNQTIEELRRKNDEMQDQSIVSTINVLRSLNISEEEIIPRVCEQYLLSEEQVKKYF